MGTVRKKARRAASIQRIWDAVHRFTSENGPQEADRRAHEVLVTVLGAMAHPGPGSAALLAKLAHLARSNGKAEPFTLDLVDAVAMVTVLAAEEPLHRRSQIQATQVWPADGDSVFGRLFSGLSVDAATAALEAQYAWMKKGKNRTPAGIVSNLLFAALQRKVAFPGSNLGKENTPAHVRTIVANARIRVSQITRK
jgi:hypothetical protein